MTSLATLDARVRSAALRLRLQRAADATTLAAASCVALFTLALAAAWFARWPLRSESAVWIALVALPLGAGAAAALRRVARLPLVIALDRSYGLPDLLSSAWSFAQLPAAARSPFMSATLASAERTAAAIEVARSQPFRRPRGSGGFALALACAVAIWHALPPQPSAVGVATPAAAPPVSLERLLSSDQLAAFRRRLALLDAELPSSAEAAALRAALQRLVEELAGGPADRLRVLRRLAALEARARVLAAQPGAARDSAERSAAEWSDEPPAPLSQSPTSSAEPPPAEPPAAPQQSQASPPGQTRGPDLPDSEGAGPRDPSTSPQPGDAPAPQGEPGRGALPQPSAAAPSSGGSDGPRGPQLERPSEQAGGEALADAISELRDLVNRNQQLPGDPNDPTGSPRTPKQPEGNPPDRDDSRADRTGSPNAAYASSGPPPQANGDGPGEGDEVPQLPAEATRVAGANTGGPVRSQVIYGAAERGFGGRDYARVHGDYERHAERELDREAVPPGFRSYVRRYFQAIAPRTRP